MINLGWRLVSELSLVWLSFLHLARSRALAPIRYDSRPLP